MAFLRRSIDVYFFNPGTKKNILVVQDAYVTCDISDIAGESSGEMVMMIYGLSQSSMDKISSDGLSVSEINEVWCRVVAISVDVSGNKKQSIAYEGHVVESATDYNNAPSPSLMVHCNTGLPITLHPMDATSLRGDVRVVDAIRGILKGTNFLLDINDNGAVIRNIYLSGSAMQQLSQICFASGLKFTIYNGTIKVFPPILKERQGNLTLLNAESGMVGYPVVNGNKISVKSIYNPAFLVNSLIKIESSIKSANGVFQVLNASHHLEVNTGGDSQFFSLVVALRLN